MSAARICLSLAALLVITGCSTWDDNPAPVQATTKELPRSKSGNPPFYEVYGVRYKVMNSSVGYKERGVASWYGKKFHGRPTSSGERYNMHAMTAAHKTLPLPTIVKVTNLTNGKSVIVKVNDRGPFIDNRIIDMSYAAAIKLDMTGPGTALVEVEALTSDPNTGQTVAQQNPASNGKMYMQVGAFGEAGNAHNLAQQLQGYGISNVRVYAKKGEIPALYRVRIGPVSTVSEYDRIAAKIQGLQLSDPQLVVENY